MATLNYAIPVVPAGHPIVGRIAAWGNACWAAGLTLWLIGFAQTYFVWNQDWCGTPAARMQTQFFILSPVLLGVPAGGWAVAARFAHFGQRLARGAFLASAASWAVTAVFIQHG
jgi:hypothetical protein